MANLSSLIRSKAALSTGFDEDNLMKGQIYVYGLPDERQTCFGQLGTFCWNSPGCGTAIVEIWGAGGSASAMCCCGVGLPGNAGAYAKKTIVVDSGSYITGLTGKSCNDTTLLCFKGCSSGTCICYVAPAGNGTVCAMGGRAGESRCLNSATGNMYDCFVSLGYSGTSYGNGCGLICNHSSSTDWNATATGGDINCSGGFSCLKIMTCNPTSYCCYTHFMRLPAGMGSENGHRLEVRMGFNSDLTKQPSPLPFYNALLAGMGKSPISAHPFGECQGNWVHCSAVEAPNCAVMFGTAVPAPGSHPCAGTWDRGLRGGMGGVRIQFIKDKEPFQLDLGVRAEDIEFPEP